MRFAQRSGYRNQQGKVRRAAAEAGLRSPADYFLESYFAGMRSFIAFAIGIRNGGSEFIKATVV